jgi:uncharacterized membrane protein
VIVMHTRSRILKVSGIVVLGCLALVLYADLQSVHQIYHITQRSIDTASDAQTRGFLLHDRDRRNREEQFQKLMVGGVLAGDIAWILFLGVSLVRPAVGAALGAVLKKSAPNSCA